MTENHNRRRFLQSSLAAGSVLTLASGTAPQGDAAPAAAPANPRVPAGRVRWHDDFAAAQAASQRSGKPVLLFHMMGRLDQKFC